MSGGREITSGKLGLLYNPGKQSRKENRENGRSAKGNQRNAAQRGNYRELRTAPCTKPPTATGRKVCTTLAQESIRQRRTLTRALNLPQGSGGRQRRTQSHPKVTHTQRTPRRTRANNLIHDVQHLLRERVGVVWGPGRGQADATTPARPPGGRRSSSRSSSSRSSSSKGNGTFGDDLTF